MAYEMASVGISLKLLPKRIVLVQLREYRERGVMTMGDGGDEPVEGSDAPTAENIGRWRAAAADGNVDAMCNLGLMCYQNGQLFGSDSAETWWIQAANKGHPDAMLNLGLLRYGQDLVVGENSAEHWWLLAADLGNADAMCNLGVLRHAQTRLAGDDSAEHWWERAAAVDHPDAVHNLELLKAEIG